MAALIEVEGVSKTFPGVKALSDVRFDLMPGEVHALMGENGAGKSTLMKILSGVYQQDVGDILLDGQPIDIDGPAHAQPLGIGIVHQELHLMPHLTAAQNIFIGREPRKAGGCCSTRTSSTATPRNCSSASTSTVDPRTRSDDLTVARSRWWRSPRRCPTSRAC